MNATYEMPQKLYNHGFTEGEKVRYGTKEYTVIVERPNFLYVEDENGERFEIWSKHLAVIVSDTDFNKVFDEIEFDSVFTD